MSWGFGYDWDAHLPKKELLGDEGLLGKSCGQAEGQQSYENRSSTLHVFTALALLCE